MYEASVGVFVPFSGKSIQTSGPCVRLRRGAQDRPFGSPEDAALSQYVQSDAAGGRGQPSRRDSVQSFSVPIESERRLQLFVLARFLYANRYPLRWKTLQRIEKRYASPPLRARSKPARPVISLRSCSNRWRASASRSSTSLTAASFAIGPLILGTEFSPIISSTK